MARRAGRQPGNPPGPAGGTVLTERRRSWWGWGWEDQGPNREQTEAIAAGLAARFGLGGLEVAEPARLEDLELRPPRVEAPRTLAHCLSDSVYDRAGHTYGKAYRDVVRAFRGQLDHPPDLVAFPADEGEVTSLLDWASSTHTAVVPYGGGSSVVGGVECRGDGYDGVVSMDLGRLDRVLEVDEVSRAARVQAGVYGPALEEQLRPRDLTLRHFPQSFEFSTLGGWLATRSGGHYATVRTHIDDFVESLRVVCPQGVVESRRLPGSGAGPSPDRMFLGSEGTLGVITEAWMRLQDRPRWRASAPVRFTSYAAAVAATRDVAQSGLDPANCRLLDEEEAGMSAGSGGGVSVLVLGFESADHPVETDISRAVEICSGHGGAAPDGVRISGPTAAGDGPSGDGGAVATWRNSFIRAPYARDALVAMSMVVDTFETACTWNGFEALHAGVTETVTRALTEICGGGWMTCRFTHVYPDGPAPYFSVFGPGRPGSEVSQWDELKAAASEAVLAHGGTITHHHAVGRDHRPWYDRQRPELFAGALRAAKEVLDPAGILNPGVLIDPR